MQLFGVVTTGGWFSVSVPLRLHLIHNLFIKGLKCLSVITTEE